MDYSVKIIEDYYLINNSVAFLSVSSILALPLKACCALINLTSSSEISVFEFSKLPFCIDPNPKSLGLPNVGTPYSVVCKKFPLPIERSPDSLENLANPT